MIGEYSMKKFGMKRMICVVLCAVFLMGVGGVSAYAFTAKQPETENTDEKTEALSAASPSESGVNAKDETVYVIANADGSVKKIVVSDWVKNNTGADTIRDMSDLENVENVKGDETYTMDGDMRVWDAAGGDIYYQGTTEKTLPVEMSISYTLDGKSISPEELAGKSGRVTIRYDYKNNQKAAVEIDGREEEIYVPFAMLTGILLDTDVFTNVTVSNGKLISDGDRVAVVGIAFPGLQDDLGIDREALEIPDYVLIEADAEEFSLGTTVTIAASDLFSGMGDEALGTIGVEDLTASLDQLNDGMNRLLDGSSQLYGGLCTLLDKSGALINGIDALAAGAQELKNGAVSLDEGVVKFQEGAASFNSGLAQIDANSDALNAGAKQVFETLLKEVETQIKAAGLDIPELTVDNYSEVLGGILDKMENAGTYAQSAAKDKITAAVKTKEADIRAAVTAAVSPEVEKQVTAAVREAMIPKALAAMNVTEEAYKSGSVPQAQLDAVLDQIMADETVKSTVSAKTDEQMQSDEVKALIESKVQEQIDALVNENMSSAQVRDQITAAQQQASAGLPEIKAAKTQLDSYAQFYNGLKAYTDGVGQAADGAAQLGSGADSIRAGADAIAKGADSLYQGILTMKDGSAALVEGVTALRDGAMQLNDGLSELYEKGFSRIAELSKGGLANVAARLRAVVDAAKDFNSFAGIGEDMEGTVRFVYRTESVKLPSSQN